MAVVFRLANLQPPDCCQHTRGRIELGTDLRGWRRLTLELVLDQVTVESRRSSNRLAGVVDDHVQAEASSLRAATCSSTQSISLPSVHRSEPGAKGFSGCQVAQVQAVQLQTRQPVRCIQLLPQIPPCQTDGHAHNGCRTCWNRVKASWGKRVTTTTAAPARSNLRAIYGAGRGQLLSRTETAVLTPTTVPCRLLRESQS